MVRGFFDENRREFMSHELDLLKARLDAITYQERFFLLLTVDSYSDEVRLQAIENYQKAFNRLITGLSPEDAATLNSEFQYFSKVMADSLAILRADQTLPVLALSEANLLKILKDPAKFEVLAFDKFGPIRVHKLLSSGTGLQSIDSREQTTLSEALEALFDLCQCEPNLKVMLDDVTGYLKTQSLPIFVLEFDNGNFDTMSFNTVFPSSGTPKLGVVILSDNVLTALDGQSDILVMHLQNELFELAWHLKWKVGDNKLVHYAKFQAVSAVVSHRLYLEILNHRTLTLAELKDLWKQAKAGYANDPANPHKGDFDYTGDPALKKLIEAMIQFATKGDCKTLHDLNTKWP